MDTCSRIGGCVCRTGEDGATCPHTTRPAPPDPALFFPDPAGGDFTPRPWLPEVDYYRAGGIDIRDVIEAFALNFNRGGVLKYIARAGRKPGNDPLLDLRKARQQLDREIAWLERAENAEPA
jgi:hypothetical protein